MDENGGINPGKSPMNPGVMRGLYPGYTSLCTRDTHHPVYPPSLHHPGYTHHAHHAGYMYHGQHRVCTAGGADALGSGERKSLGERGREASQPPKCERRVGPSAQSYSLPPWKNG